jgi:hypothetical protein
MGPDGDLRDDPSIPDSELLNRRVLWCYVVDGTGIASGAFINRDKSDPHVSVDLASLSSPQQTLGRWPLAAGVAQILVEFVRQHTPGVVRRPAKDNPAHALIIRDLSLSNSRWKEVARMMAKACDWAIPPKT